MKHAKFVAINDRDAPDDKYAFTLEVSGTVPGGSLAVLRSAPVGATQTYLQWISKDAFEDRRDRQLLNFIGWFEEDGLPSVEKLATKYEGIMDASRRQGVYDPMRFNCRTHVNELIRYGVDNGEIRLTDPYDRLLPIVKDRATTKIIDHLRVVCDKNPLDATTSLSQSEIWVKRALRLQLCDGGLLHSELGKAKFVLIERESGRFTSPPCNTYAFSTLEAAEVWQAAVDRSRDKSWLIFKSEVVDGRIRIVDDIVKKSENDDQHATIHAAAILLWPKRVKCEEDDCELDCRERVKKKMEFQSPSTASRAGPARSEKRKGDGEDRTSSGKKAK